MARDNEYLKAKVEELTELSIPYLVVCGEKIDRKDVIFREPKGKFDAINFGLSLIPKESDIIILNDVDTKIHNFQAALDMIEKGDNSLVFCGVKVKQGPQKQFYKVLDPIRRKLPIAASGELMLIKRGLMDSVLPLEPCKAEDSYILFKALEKGQKVAFCEACFVETERTKTLQSEQAYKRRTVCGLYQAISLTNTSKKIKFFFFVLPFASPFLLALGKNGYYWMKGILLGLQDYLKGDRAGTWKKTST